MAAAENWNKATRLAVAGQVAPHLRDQSDRSSMRRVARVDADGNVVGYTTLADVQKALLERHKIEIDVVDGVKRKEIICEQCGLPSKVRERQRLKRCDRCTFLSCADCGKELPRNYSSPSMRRKSGGDVCCRPCRKARTVAGLPECADCRAKVDRRSEWQYRRRWGEDVPLRCGPCSREARKLPRPRCCGCSKELPRSALSNARARAGKPPMCSRCYRGDVRAEIAREKIATDPDFAAKAKEALSIGRGWQKHRPEIGRRNARQRDRRRSAKDRENGR